MSPKTILLLFSVLLVVTFSLSVNAEELGKGGGEGSGPGGRFSRSLPGLLKKLPRPHRPWPRPFAHFPFP